MASPNSVRLSIVIPARNEAGNIGRLVRETYKIVPREVLAEIIVVDDASDDTTFSEVDALTGERPGLRCLRHQTHSGQSAAVRSGILAASGNVIATMDGDGQNDPRDIMRLVGLLAPTDGNGPALVGGIRARRRGSRSKRWASKFANWLRDRLLRDDCPDTGCGIKVYWREAFLRLPFFNGMHRYLPALFISYGFEVAYIPVNDRERLAGRSNYTNLARALAGVHDLIGVRWLIRRTVWPSIVRPAEREESRCLIKSNGVLASQAHPSSGHTRMLENTSCS